VPIATDTPEEIAISIMAEIVDVRRQNKKKNKLAEKSTDNETSDSHQ
jgi:xanthine/CO dehydrogenase XdhC/CoxF family maturation factor